MREIVSPLSGIRSPFGVRRAGSGGPSEPTITSSDGEPASLTNNGDGTYGVVVGGTTVGTITQAQINAGGFITVVAPAAGMSGSNVVLTTTGYVIHVGSTPIETDVEVLADAVVVGTALPFDATAYPNATLTVRFSYSVGGPPLVISTTARLAPLRLAQFRDSVLVGTTPSDAWPSGQRTRQATIAFRLSGIINSALSGTSLMRVIMLSLINLRNSTPGLISTFNPTGSGLGGDITIIGTSASAQQCSMMFAIDLDGGLPGGETFVVWSSNNGGAWARRGGRTATQAGNLMGLLHFGSVNGVSVGGAFDIHNQIWMANQALDPAVHWDKFFEADGQVKRLPTDGVVQGVTPVIYLRGDGIASGTNLGSGTDLTPARTAITMVNA